MPITNITRPFSEDCYPVGGGYIGAIIFDADTTDVVYDANGNVTDISNAEEAECFDLPIFPDSMEFSELEKTSSVGTFIEVQLSFSILNQEELRAWRKKYRNAKFFALITKPDGSQRFIGKERVPLYLVVDFNDGKKFSDAQKGTLKFTSQQLDYAPMAIL
jgi:hypothetical protein